MKKTCIIIAGPTAVGKTAVAIDIARHFYTQIISADSRQCYKELNIGVAKPSPEELAAVPHHFINSHSIADNLSAADFETIALGAAGSIFKTNDIAVMVGGTGLYIKAFSEGMDEIPVVPELVRNGIQKDYHTKGIEWLQQSLEKEDPGYFMSGEMKNPQRMMRALEVKRSTGSSIIAFQSRGKKDRDFDIIKICLDLPRAALYERINHRVDQMIIQGLADEVEGLIPFKSLNALQTVGYRELFEYFDKMITISRAVELIKQNTRNYAKRQVTWFKKDLAFMWMQPETKLVLGYLERKLNG
jgi:tRNA dimethylallyltransferase